LSLNDSRSSCWSPCVEPLTAWDATIAPPTTGAITSGELTHRYLAGRPDAWWQHLGRRCIHLTWSSRGAISLDALDLEIVQSPDDEPDFLLAHGTEALGAPTAAGPGAGARGATLDELKALVERCAAVAAARGRPMPMVVANPGRFPGVEGRGRTAPCCIPPSPLTHAPTRPTSSTPPPSTALLWRTDIVTVDGAGGLITMPGTISNWYALAGGEVRLMGKPGRLIYDAAAQLAPGVAPGRWLAVGDSLEHDIGGAQAARTGPSLFIAGGIHAEDVRLQGGPGTGNAGSSWDGAALGRLCEEHGATPSYAAAWMEW
jgi:hypothetical protein